MLKDFNFLPKFYISVVSSLQGAANFKAMPDIQQIKDDLKKQQQQIEKNLLSLQSNPAAELPESVDIGSYSWFADVYSGTEIIREKLNNSLKQILKSLEKINLGIYGSCERCNQPINPERLKVLPFATTCLVCI